MWFDWTARKEQLARSVSTLKFRIQLLMTLLLVAVVGGPLWFLVYLLDRNYQEFQTNMMETATHAVYQSIFNEIRKADKSGVQTVLENYPLQPGVERLRIFVPGGEILFSSDRDELRQNVYELAAAQGLAPQFSRAGQELFVKSGGTYIHHHPMVVQKECTPCHQNLGETIAFIDVQVELSESEFLYASTKRLVIFSAILIMAILWLSLNGLYESQIESRLQKIMRGFQELARGNLQHRVDLPGRHELAELARAFNHTVEELAAARAREERFIQENLARADRLITMGEVAAEIAHEVNNPAGIILTRAEIVKDELQALNGQGGDCIEDLEMIIRQTERIAETTRNVLQYARKLPDRFSTVDLQTVIRSSVNILAPRIKKVGATVHIYALEHPAMVRGNANQLEQVFCNLINNSLDAIQPGAGEISVTVETCALGDGIPGYRVIFSDNGPGVPPGIRKDIFSPFFTTKFDRNGTGLGLFIVRNIITHHKGKIYLGEDSPKAIGAAENNRTASGAMFVIELEAAHAES